MNNVGIKKLEQLLECHQGSDADETTQEVMTTVLDTLHYIYIANDQFKCILDDYGQVSGQCLR